MTYFKPLTTLTALTAAAGLFVAPAQATVLFSDDFESYSVDEDFSTLTTDWSTVEPAPATSDAGVFTRDGDSEGANFSPFGSPNQYLEMSKGGGSDTVRAEKAGITGAGTVGSLRFDLHHASDNPFRSETEEDTDEFAVEFDNGSGDRIAILDFTNGTVSNREEGVGGSDRPTAEYGMDTSLRVTVVVNNKSTGSLSYGSGGDDLDEGNLDLWLDDDLVFNNSPVEDTSNLGDALSSISMTIFGGKEDSAAFIDNVEYHDEAIVGEAIPEPASLALLGLGGLAMLSRRRG